MAQQILDSERYYYGTFPSYFGEKSLNYWVCKYLLIKGTVTLFQHSVLRVFLYLFVHIICATRLINDMHVCVLKQSSNLKVCGGATWTAFSSSFYASCRYQY